MRMLVLVVATVAAVLVPGSAEAHRNPCHVRHTCPSDHHTYRWKGLSCTSYASERKASDKTIVRVAGRRYWCHR